MGNAIALILHSITSKSHKGDEEAPSSSHGDNAAQNHSFSGGFSRAPAAAEEDDGSLETPRRKTRWQNLLRFFAAAFGFLAMGFFAAATRHVNDGYVNINGHGDWTDGYALVAPILAMIIEPLIIVRNMFKRRSSHHLARTGIAIGLFAIGLSSLVLAILGGIFWQWRTSSVAGPNGVVDCDNNPANFFTYDCNPTAYTIGHEQIGGICFLGLLCACQLGLLVVTLGDALAGRRGARQKRLTRSFDMQFAPPKALDDDSSRATSSGTRRA